MNQTFQALCVLLLSIGCTSGQFKPEPLPPTYGQDCTPSHKTYENWALETVDLALPDEIPEDPKKALEAIELKIHLRGILIVPKPKTGVNQFDKFTTTLPLNIYVSPKFPTYSDAQKANILWHEYVHVRQWERLGVQEFARRWLATAEGRFSLEVAAYRESYRVHRLFGTFSNEIDLRKHARARAKSVYEGYAMAGMPKNCMVDLAVKIWGSDGIID